MGTVGDNLLKLTEFPFSYSFVGLLALMFGPGWNFGDEEFFNRLGPLLILMGFVATTLAITDPIGALQKMRLTRLKDTKTIEKGVIKLREDQNYYIETLLLFTVFGTRLHRLFRTESNQNMSGTILASLSATFMKILSVVPMDMVMNIENLKPIDIRQAFDHLETEEISEIRTRAESLRGDIKNNVDRKGN
jgi:hypothetical protein